MILPSIESIGRIMADQDNRATQYPLYAIQEDVRVWVNPGDDYDERERKEDADTYWLCDECTKLEDEGDELPEDCQACDSEAFDHYRLEKKLAIELAGVFFTDVACQQHIDENRYHYRNPQVYGIAAWRNPEMVAVQQHLIKAAGKEILSHYA